MSLWRPRSPFDKNGEEPLLKKKKKKASLVIPHTTISSLPDDLVLSCLASVPRLHYPTLPLVSKRFQSLLASPEFYKTRSLLGRTQSCLYVSLKLSIDSNLPRWFNLCQKPNQTLTNHTSENDEKKSSSGYALAPISIPNCPHTAPPAIVSVGSNIYTIGGPINDSPSARVSVLDCRSHTWREAPSMRVERSFAAANVFDGKIYVAGGYKDSNSSNWMEVFDPKTQAWEHVLSPLGAERCGSLILKRAVIKGEICMFGHKGVTYKPKEDRWEMIREMTYLELGWALSYCMIDNVLYSYNNSDGIEWYDSKIKDKWVKLKGLKELPKFHSYNYVKLVDYGGKIAIFWDEYVTSSANWMIWCAVIALERRKNENILGKVEWFDVVLKVPNSFTFVSALSATV